MIKQHHFRIIALFAFAIFIPFSTMAGTGNNIYVDANVSGGLGNGSSWDNAFPILQDALAAATSGDTIHVAQGAYYPDEGTGHINNNSSETFQLPSAACLLGGYATGGGVRDPARFPTILSGDINQSRDTNGDGIVDILPFTPGTAASTVLTLANDALPITLDGIVITGAANQGVTATRTGVTMNNCRFIRNTARAAVFIDARIDPTLDLNCTFCDFIGNGDAQANSGGGGLAVEGLNATIEDCTFEDNQVNSSFGGGLFYTKSAGSNIFASLTVVRCAFKGNRAANGGGAYVTGAVNSGFTSCLFSGNRSGNPGVISHGGGAYFTQVPVNPSFPSASRSGPTTFSNCTIAWNTCATGGGGVYFGASTNKNFYNCILTGNLVASDSTDSVSSVFVASGSQPNYWSTYAAGLDLDLMYPGNGNFDFFTFIPPTFEQDVTLTLDPGNSIPLFPFYPPTTSGDLRQTRSSTLKDAGNNIFVGADTDLLGKGRIRNKIVDPGAYEVPNTVPILITKIERLVNGLKVFFESDDPVDVYWSTDLSNYSLLFPDKTDNFSRSFSGPKRYFVLVPAGAGPP